MSQILLYIIRSDLLHDYYQDKNIDFLKSTYGKEQWVQISGEKKQNNSTAHFWCSMFDTNYIEEIMSSPEWDSSCNDGFPGFIWFSDKTLYERFCLSHDYIEPLLFYREFYGVKENYIEVCEEFRLLNNLYFEKNDGSYYTILESGNCDEVIRIIDSKNIFISLKYLNKYAAAKQMGILLFFDITYETQGSLADNNLSTFHKHYKDESLIYEIYGNDDIILHKSAYSRLLGKKILLPQPVTKCGYYPYDQERSYLDYIIGIDENGNNLTYTSNPDKLSNNFGANPGAPNYLTPVFFKREVLDKYIKCSNLYKIEDGRLTCGSLWSIRIDNDHKSFIAAYLGDLGRDLPEDEQLYWKSYNVPCDETLSQTAVQRDFCCIWAEPSTIDLKFKRDYNILQEKWNSKFNWYIFKKLTLKDKYNLENIRIPSTNSQEEFDSLVLSLVKSIIDSINEEMLVISVSKDSEGKQIHGISKIEKWLSENKAVEYEEHILFLRDLQELRSSGTGHRKGKKYDKISKKFNMDKKPLIDIYEQILIHADDFIIFLTDLLDKL